MEAKKRTSWELLGQMALSKSKTIELLGFLRGQAPARPRRLKRWRALLSRSLPAEERLSETIGELREDRI